MYNLIQADLFKMRKSMAIKILFGITTVSSVTMAVMAYLIPQGILPASMGGIGFLLSDMSMISLLGAVLAGVFICGDFDNKTIHDAIANGCSRGGIIVSKAITFCSTLAFIILPYAIVTGVALSTSSKFSMGSTPVAGFLNILTKDGGTSFSSGMIFKLLAVMLTLVIVDVAQLIVCVLLAFTLKKPVLVVAIYYGLSFLSGQLASLNGSSKLFDTIYACTPFGGNYFLTTLNTGTVDLLKAISASLIFILVILAITYGAFRKSEIK